MAFDFTGKKFLVTGAGSGIGRGIALGLVKAGAKVYALDYVQETLDTLAAENSNIVTVLQDLTNWEETTATLEKLEALDGLVNNAANLLCIKPALECSKEYIEKNFSINLLAVINCTQVIGKKMIGDERKGSIVNVSSIASHGAFHQGLVYATSKAGVDMVTKQFALELGPHNIRVNSVNPCLVETELQKAIIETNPSLKEKTNERMPLGRPATIDEIVGPVMYLLSDYASMVTGTQHLVDGGTMCNITTKQ